MGLRKLPEHEGRPELVDKNQGHVAEMHTGLPAGRSWSRGWTVSVAGPLAATGSCAEGAKWTIPWTNFLAMALQRLSCILTDKALHCTSLPRKN